MRFRIIKFFLPEYSLLFSVGRDLIKHALRCLVLKLLHLCKAWDKSWKLDKLSYGQIFFQNA